MNFSQDNFLKSESGYCMPFDEGKGDVHLCLGYGEQMHPDTKQPFFHRGVDFLTDHYTLYAVADGVVTGYKYGLHGEGHTLEIRYGRYEVTYRHLANFFVKVGWSVKAGTVVAESDAVLHIGVTFDGKNIDPIEFLRMLHGNIAMQNTEFDTIPMDIPTDYDDDHVEIEQLMLKYYPEYLSAIGSGGYALPERTEQSLRNLFSQSAIRSFFFESLPSLANPLGIGTRAMPIAAKVQNLLIGDFLTFLALQHGIFLSSWSEERKKKLLTRPSSSSTS